MHIKDTSDLKVYMREDILHMLIGARAASVALDDARRSGFDLCVASLCMMIGIDSSMAGIASNAACGRVATQRPTRHAAARAVTPTPPTPPAEPRRSSTA